MSMFTYDLLIGLPHTNYNQLAEHLLLMHLGHFQWQSIARSIDSPLSHLRTIDGGEVYAAFYYIEERIPEQAPLTSFQLDDTIQIRLHLRGFRNMAVDGRMIFQHKSHIEAEGIHTEEDLLSAYAGTSYPSVRLANVFVTPHGGNAGLKFAPPANTSFEKIPNLRNEDNAYNITRAAEKTWTFGVFDEDWVCLNPEAPFTMPYSIDPDRDSNGAKLVYFANYIAFLDTAERMLLQQDVARYWPIECVPTRTLRLRKLAYYGNADLDNTLRISILLFHHKTDETLIGFRYAITREMDDTRICLSEAIKAVTRPRTENTHTARTLLDSSQ